MSAFGTNMRRLRTGVPYSLRELSAASNVSHSYLSKIEHGDVGDPPAPTALAIDRALGAGGQLAALSRPGQSPADIGPVVILEPIGAPDAPLGAEDVGRLQDRIRQLVDLDREYGGNELVPLGVRAFKSAQAQLNAGAIVAGQGTDLRRVVAELAQVCGWLAYDADQQDLARRMFNEAVLLAELAGDFALEMFVRDQRAMQAQHAGRLEEALAMAERAIDHPRVTGRMEAIFHLRRGRALAGLGIADASLDALARSRSALAEGMTSKDSPWTWWIHEAEVDLHGSLALSALGRHGEAVELSTRAMAALPVEQVRDWAVYQAYRIEVLSAAGAWNDTVVALDELATRLPRIGSTRTANLVVASATRPGTPRPVAEAAQAALAVR